MWERFKNTSKIYIKIFRKYLRYCCSVLRQNKRRLYIGPLIINKKNLITLFNQTLVYNNQGAHRAIFKRFYRSNKTFLVSVFHLLFILLSFKVNHLFYNGIDKSIEQFI